MVPDSILRSIIFKVWRFNTDAKIKTRMLQTVEGLACAGGGLRNDKQRNINIYRNRIGCRLRLRVALGDVMCTVLDHKVVTARKNHRCSLCGLRIPSGAKYVSNPCIFDGGISANKYHVECEAANEDWNEEFGDESEFQRYHADEIDFDKISTSEIDRLKAELNAAKAEIARLKATT